MKKHSALLFFFIFLTVIVPSATTVAETNIYGETGVALGYMSNSNLITVETEKETNLTADLWGTLYFSAMDHHLNHCLLALNLEGNLAASLAEEDDPVSIGVDQFYLQIPLFQDAFLYCGKKQKEKGISRFFNVSNRISPKYLVNYEVTRTAPGLVELDFIHSPALSHSYILYFPETNRWEETNIAAFMDFSGQRWTADVFCYLEKLSAPLAGFSLSYQHKAWQYYVETIWKRKADQYILRQNGVEELGLRKMDDPLAAVFGLKLTQENWCFTMEFLHRREGYNSEEQRTFIDYIKTDAGREVGFVNHDLLRNYLGISFSIDSILDSRFSAETKAICSFQPDTFCFHQYVSWQMLTQITYEITQNSLLSFFIEHAAGGKYGEFNNVYPFGQLFALIVQYYF